MISVPLVAEAEGMGSGGRRGRERGAFEERSTGWWAAALLVVVVVLGWRLQSGWVLASPEAEGVPRGPWGGGESRAALMVLGYRNFFLWGLKVITWVYFFSFLKNKNK